MKCQVSMCRTVAAAAVLMAGLSSTAFANDDSMRWVPDNAPSAWRQSHPNGLSVREMQSLWGSWAGQYSMKRPVISNAPVEASFRESHPNGPSEREMQARWGSWAGEYSLNQPELSTTAADPYFKMSHPNGLSDRELQAMSSEAPAWQAPKQQLMG